MAEAIREQARPQGIEDSFSEILVPTEDVVEIRRGRKINSERKFFPGYVLVKMELSDEAYHLIKNTPKVTGFLGSRPSRCRCRKGGARIIGAIEEGVERPKPTIRFEIGETVRVTDGPFASFSAQWSRWTRSARACASPSPSSAARRRSNSNTPRWRRARLAPRLNRSDMTRRKPVGGASPRTTAHWRG